MTRLALDGSAEHPAGLASRVAVVDLDVHQGNGTAAIFRDEPRVFTCSMHGGRNYPARKEQSDLDLPLPDGINVLDDSLCVPVHGQARRGGLHAFIAPEQEFGIEFGLEVRHLVAQRRLHDVQLARRARDAPGIDHGKEISELSQFH